MIDSLAGFPSKLNKNAWQVPHFSGRFSLQPIRFYSGRIIERFLFCSIGFGRWNDNWFLSFIEDNFFPITACCGQKLFKKKTHLSKNIIQNSWKRRVDINIFWYFGLILCLAILNILVTPCVGVLDPDFDKLPKPFDSFSMLVGLRGGLQFLMVYTQLMIVVGKKILQLWRFCLL